LLTPDERDTVYTRIYRRLIALYPPAFRERFGESMEPTFLDLLAERSVLRMYSETAAGVVKEHAFQLRQKSFMNDVITQPRTAAVLGVFLALPVTLIFLIAVFNIEPINGFLKNLFATENERMHILGLIVLLISIFLLPVACIFNVAAIGRSLCAGNGVMAHPANLMLTIGLLALIVTLAVGFVVDRYPCWMGVPNCD
jgi:hypothetical protein